mmetsp:Transcript_66088/g.99641  ORF Transcript_66088/g.99641 Transcript_66088/m.99641 type:complete len:232 (-) Transcript_66088:872-1567(-)
MTMSVRIESLRVILAVIVVVVARSRWVLVVYDGAFHSLLSRNLHLGLLTGTMRQLFRIEPLLLRDEGASGPLVQDELVVGAATAPPTTRQEQDEGHDTRRNDGQHSQNNACNRPTRQAPSTAPARIGGDGWALVCHDNSGRQHGRGHSALSEGGGLVVGLLNQVVGKLLGGGRRRGVSVVVGCCRGDVGVDGDVGGNRASTQIGHLDKPRWVAKSVRHIIHQRVDEVAALG